jgi:hypothetical protein
MQGCWDDAEKMFFSKKKHGDSYNITNVITLPGWWSGT